MDVRLRNAVITGIVDTLHDQFDFTKATRTEFFDPELILHVWHNTKEGSLLRKLTLDLYVSRVRGEDLEGLQPLYAPEFLNELLIQSLGCEYPSDHAPTDQGPCHYHWHDAEFPKCVPNYPKKRRASA